MQRAAMPPAQRRSQASEGWGKLRFAAVACCLALVGVIVSIALSSNTIETRVGEWRTVQLADGTYRLSEPLRFGPGDGGGDHAGQWTAAPGAHPVITRRRVRACEACGRCRWSGSGWATRVS